MNSFNMGSEKSNLNVFRYTSKFRQYNVINQCTFPNRKNEKHGNSGWKPIQK